MRDTFIKSTQNIIILFICLLQCISCNNSKINSYDNHGFSFNYYPEWHISKDSVINDRLTSVFLKHKRMIVRMSMISVNMVKDTIPRDSLEWKMVESLKKNETIKIQKHYPSKVKTFNGYAAHGFTIEMKINDEHYFSNYFVIKEYGNTYVVCFQYPKKDSKANLKARELFTESFVIKYQGGNR